MKKDKYYYTTLFRLAVFLYAKGEQIGSINNFKDKQKEFVFVRNPRLEELVDKFRIGSPADQDLAVNINIYEQARRELKDKIFM